MSLMHDDRWPGAIGQHPAMTLVGWTSAWQTRIRVPSSRPGVSPRIQRDTLTVTWIHHRHYGTLGVYWPQRQRLALPVRRPARPWVVVTGRIMPCQVYAQADDPRSLAAPATTPLFMLVEQLRRAQPTDTLHVGRPMLPVPATVTLGASRPLASGYLAATPWPDLRYWSDQPIGPGQGRWNRVRGVVAPSLCTARCAMFSPMLNQKEPLLMSDLSYVLLVGNLRQDVEQDWDADGTAYRHSVICVGRTTLVAGRPRTETVFIPIEMRGKARVSQFAQQFGAGSRIVCQGHLALRTAARPPRAAETSGLGAAASRAHPPDLVVVIDAVFHADLPPTVTDAPMPFWEAWTEPSRD